MSLEFPQGSKNALVGASGCGKTTLAGLLMGFWQPDEGEVRAGGASAAELTEAQIGALFSIVQQEAFLFDLSMEDNIRIGKPDASREELVAAAKKARIHDFVGALPAGYATHAGEAGVRLSTREPR